MICIKIDDRDQVLHQWDRGQRLLLHGYEAGTRVDFARCNDNKAVSQYAYSEDEAVFCDIPDALLMEPNHLHGYVYEIDGDRGETVREFMLPVIRRPKPEDYVEPEEIPIWHDLQQQIDELKENGAGGGTTDAVQYIAQKLTEDQQMQARRNLGLYGKRTELSKTEVYRYFYVGWWEGSGTLTEIPNGRSYLISVLDAEYACTSYSKTHTWSEQTTGYIGNVELIPEDVRSAYSFDESCSVDCPVVLYQVNSGSLTVVIDPDLTVPVAGGATFYELGNPVEVVDTIPEEYLPEGYGSGGYYTPSVSQPTEDTMQVDFTPSSEDMPTVDPVTVTLPAGPQGEQGEKGEPGQDGAPGDDYVLTDADRQEIAEIAAGLVEVPNVKPVAKTEDMTQPVGVDEEGRLWSAPTAGGSGGGFAEWELLGEYTLGTNIYDKVIISFADYEQTDFILVADFPKTDGLSGKLSIKSSGSTVAAATTVSQHRHQGIAMLTKNPVDGYIYGNMAISNGYTASMAPVFPSYRNLEGYKNMVVEMFPYEESEATGTVKIYGR